MAQASNSVALFAPIIFLLVVEVSNIADTIKLDKLAKENRPPFPVPIFGFRRLFGRQLIPNLGRFFFIHLASMLLLAIEAFASLTYTDGILAAGLVTATAVVLWLYPFIELTEYDVLLKEGSVPQSYRSHSTYAAVIVGLVIFTPSIVVFLREYVHPIVGMIFLFVPLVFIPYLSARSFTLHLKKELS